MEQTLGMPSSGLRAMLAGDKHEQLALVYRLYSRVEGGLGIVKEMMARIVEEEGKALVADPEKEKDPTEYVEGLLRMKDKYGGIVDAAFDVGPKLRQRHAQGVRTLRQPQRALAGVHLAVRGR